MQEAPKSLGGEDFAYYQEKLPGVFASIGTGLSAPNHNPKFKVDPSAIAARCKTSGSYCRRSTKEACQRCLSSAVPTIRLGESGQKDYLANNLPKARLIEPEGTYLIWIDFSAYNLPDEVLDDLIINKGRKEPHHGKIYIFPSQFADNIIGELLRAAPQFAIQDVNY